MRIFGDFLGEAQSGNSVASLSSPSNKLVISVPRAVITIASGRGGTGKSVLTVNIAAAIALSGRKIGILDLDLNAPAIPSLLGIKPFRMVPMVGGIEPAGGPLGLRVMAANLMPDREEPPLISFAHDEPEPVPVHETGPIKANYSETITTLAGQTRFGPVDLVLIDLAPGLDHLYRVIRMIEMNAVIMVGHPSELSARAIRAGIEMLAGGPQVAGVIENMVGFNCSTCHSVRPLFPAPETAGAGPGLPLLARLPFDPRLAECAARGTIFVREYPETPLARQITELARQIEQLVPARQQRELLAASRP
jgi:ATP-binding protein involved in chromosome partitioning